MFPMAKAQSTEHSNPLAQTLLIKIFSHSNRGQGKLHWHRTKPHLLHLFSAKGKIVWESGYMVNVEKTFIHKLWFENIGNMNKTQLICDDKFFFSVSFEVVPKNLYLTIVTGKIS